MKERPILFSAPMVRAILDGSKTQTRRIAKIKPPLCNAPYFPTGKVLSDLPRQPGAFMEFRYENQPAEAASFLLDCPHGKPGDRLWVRETWMDLVGTGVEHYDERGQRRRYAYGADTLPGSYGDEARKDYGLKWRPSIHMPRAVCRIMLEITGVRVERLQDISEADAIAEGPAPHPAGPACAFSALWRSINGIESWVQNPWVWVIEFQRVMPG